MSPDFIGIGGMRCGTTTLWNVLRSCPDIYLPDNKESHFFDRREPISSEDVLTYKAQFRGARKDQIRGEFTPDYLSSPTACRLISDHLPEVKLLAILRNPVERAWSHYLFSARWGPETLSFEKALQREDARLSRGGREAEIFYSYFHRGRYALFLNEYAKRFSKEQMIVVLLEDLIDHPQGILDEIRSRIGLPPILLDSPEIRPKNASADFPRYRRLYQFGRRWRAVQGNSLLKKAVRRISRTITQETLGPIPPRNPDIFNSLEAKFQPYNEQLATWLGRDPLPW